MSVRMLSLYGVLIAVAAAFALATRAQESSPDTASANNLTGAGTAALIRYLEQRGANVSLLTEPIQHTPTNVKVIVLPAPTARRVAQEEVTWLRHFVEDGGVLIYLRPRHGEQSGLDEWLAVAGGELPASEPLSQTNVDPGGVTTKAATALGLPGAAQELRVSGDTGLRTASAQLVVVASAGKVPELLFGSFGKGQVYVAAGADLAENRRIELLDNVRFWDGAARLGPIVFDEFHHVAPARPPVSLGLYAFALQALFAVAFLALARGTRLGPLPPPSPAPARAGIEYAHSFATLLERSRVEKELAAELYARLRQILCEQTSAPASLPDDELTLLVEARLGLEPGAFASLRARFLAAQRQDRVTPEQFQKLSADAALIERKARGL